MNCHKMVRSVARGMAHELYAEVMSDNAVWKNWKAQCPDLTPRRLEAMFVHMAWPKLIEEARATLAKLLASEVNPILKEQIYDALIKDNMARQRQGQAIN